MQRFKQYLTRYYTWIRYDYELEPTFALCGDISLRNDDARGLWDVQDIVEKFRFAWGVPKIRTCQAKKTTRKFDIHRTLELKTKMVVCHICGSYHDYDKICAICYKKVRELTNLMKSKIMAYNPYIGEKQSTNVKFEDDPRPESSETHQDDGDAKASIDRTDRKRIVELGIPRPTWFKPKFIDSSVCSKQ
ncbi:ribosomal protein L32 containing protein [Loa loa]|uniref:Ribosomal protein L32 containing protein n=1 Tax=Loa loa TaxID=7209 RepID=A0A1I7VV42_LOALO|nr:ribosomal protein L32 containing protein [Loa loa]EFO22605.1 ribosomal protein L32 containing protein [Loa loa]